MLINLTVCCLSALALLAVDTEGLKTKTLNGNFVSTRVIAGDLSMHFGHAFKELTKTYTKIYSWY